MFNSLENKFKIGDLTIKLPIVQGGMGVGVSLSSLAAAVANEGGIGVLSAAGIGLVGTGMDKKGMEYNCEALANEIRRTRSLTDGAIGVNIMVALSDFGDMVKTSIDEGVDVIFAGAGLPLTLPSFIKEGSKTKIVPIISSAKAVKTISTWWQEKYNYIADAFVLEGPMAGGHLGFKREQIDNFDYSLEALVPQVKQEIEKLEAKSNKKIPLIAGGGVFSGMDMKRILSLGADAVQMGTRFVATTECDASDEFKAMYVNCKENDIEIIESPVGLPGRAINNDFLRAVKNGEKKPYTCPFHCIKTCKEEESPYCISVALLNACKGKLQNGFAFIGAKGYMIDKVISVKELFKALENEYNS